MRKLLAFILFISISTLSFSNELIEREVYENGQVKYEITQDCEDCGYNFNSYFEDGKKMQVGYYDSYGYKSGIWKLYNDNGILILQVRYSGGMKDGDWFSYSDEGQVLVQAFYKNGKRHGEWFGYDEYGRLIETRVYRKGKTIEGWKWVEDKGMVAQVP